MDYSAVLCYVMLCCAPCYILPHISFKPINAVQFFAPMKCVLSVSSLVNLVVHFSSGIVLSILELGVSSLSVGVVSILEQLTQQEEALATLCTTSNTNFTNWCYYFQWL